MKKGNNSSLTKLTAIVLLLTMVALILISGTYAKYTTEKTASDTAIVAKWAVKINDKDATSDEAITFNLFNKSGVFDLNKVADINDLSEETGEVDTDVVNTGAKVAPGTWGKVSFEVKNESDVAANYGINISSLTTTLPLEFSANGTTWVSAKDITAPYELGAGKLDIGSTLPTTETVSLYWRWVYEKGSSDEEKNTNNSSDTTLGKEGIAQCDISAGVIFTQVD